MQWIKKLYDWVLSWEKSPYSIYALFILAFIESIFFPIPPDVLLIALALGNSKKSFYYAFICTTASILGAMLGYALGHFAWLTPDGQFTPFATFFFNNIPSFDIPLYEKIRVLYNEWNFWVVFTAGFTPIPYKVITITAGVFNIDFFMFLIASIVGRSGRFFLVALMIWKFGEPIRGFIDKYFNWLALAFTVLLIGGFLVIKYFI